MSRSSAKVFSKSHNPKARRLHIDYDYLDKLSASDKEWLAKFTDEYYGASFEMNPAFMKKDELITLLTKKVESTNSKKWKNHLERVKGINKRMIQISRNENKHDDIDLRSCRSHNIYYKNADGKYEASDYYKYAETNIINPNDKELMNECNSRANSQKDCIYGKYTPNSIENEDYFDNDESIDPESLLVEYEESMIEKSLNS